jgi:hypothetical protein
VQAGGWLICDRAVRDNSVFERSEFQLAQGKRVKTTIKSPVLIQSEPKTL